MNTKDVTLISVDDGSSFVKLSWFADGELKTYISSSQCLPQEQIDPLTHQPSKHSFKTDMGDYTVSNTLGTTLGNNSPIYQYSPQNRAAIHNALLEAGFSGKKVHLCVTLPLAQYFRADGSRNEEVIAKKEDSLMDGEITSSAGLPLAEVEALTVMPEGYPAAASCMQDFDGKPKLKVADTDSFIVIDIGDTTTDVARFNAQGHVFPGQFRSIPQGVSHLKREIQKEVARHTQYDGPISDPVAEKILIDGIFSHQGTDHDLSASVNMVEGRGFNQLLNELHQIFQRLDDARYIFLVGGGAYLYQTLFMADYERTLEVPEDPQMALSLGILNIMTRQKQQQKQEEAASV